MTTAASPSLQSYCESTARAAREASLELGQASGAQKNGWLRASAQALRKSTAALLAANALDIAAAPGFGLSDAEIDRLKLNSARIEAIAVLSG